MVAERFTSEFTALSVRYVLYPEMKSVSGYVASRAELRHIVDAKWGIADLARLSSSPDQLWLNPTLHRREDGVLPSADDMLALGILRRPKDDLSLASIIKELELIAHVGSRGLEMLRQLCDMTDEGVSIEEHIACTARDLKDLATVAPEVVRHALCGRLRSAISSISSGGYEGDARYFTSVEIIDLVETVAKFHVFDCLIGAAEDAHARHYATTGLPDLDNNGGKQTTKASVLNAIERELKIINRLLKIHRDKTRSAKKRMKKIARDTVVQQLWQTHKSKLESLEKAVTLFMARPGRGGAVGLRGYIKRLLRSIKAMERGLEAARNDSRFCAEPLWQNRGPHPLQMLWLTCDFSTGWLEPTGSNERARVDRTALDGTEASSSPSNYLGNDARRSASLRPRGWGKLTDGERDDRLLADRVSRLREALEAARKEVPCLIPARAPRLNDLRARKIYFFLRSLRVQDPHSIVVKAAGGQTEAALIAAAFRLFEAESSKASQDNPFQEKRTFAEASRALEAATGRTDRVSRAFAAEAEGVISWRLRL